MWLTMCPRVRNLTTRWNCRNKTASHLWAIMVISHHREKSTSYLRQTNRNRVSKIKGILQLSCKLLTPKQKQLDLRLLWCCCLEICQDLCGCDNHVTNLLFFYHTQYHNHSTFVKCFPFKFLLYFVWWSSLSNPCKVLQIFCKAPFLNTLVSKSFIYRSPELGESK